MANSFSFTVDELNLVLKALGTLPFNESANLITRLVNEFNAQNKQDGAMAEAIQKAAQDPANIIDANPDGSPAMPPPNRKSRRAARHNGARA